jgi:branched-chain amino acid transport system ATP-binding protein
VANASTIDAPFPGKTREGTSTPVLRTEGLTIRFGGLTALDGVNLEIACSEVRAIIGPNGAGKSTFFNCVTGVLRPTSGRILFNGEDVTGLSPDRISRKGIARSYQITNILPNATALENVRIAAQWSFLFPDGGMQFPPYRLSPRAAASDRCSPAVARASPFGGTTTFTLHRRL